MTDIKITKATKVTETTQHSIYLGRTEILAILAERGWNLPPNIEITVSVPGGGDWSNTDLDISNGTTIDIRWTTVSEIEKTETEPQ